MSEPVQPYEVSTNSSDLDSYDVRELNDKTASDGAESGRVRSRAGATRVLSNREVAELAREDNEEILRQEELAKNDNELMLLKELNLEDAYRIATNASKKEAESRDGDDEENLLKQVFTQEGPEGTSQDLDLPPDGGMWAWLCVLGNLLVMFSTWGANASYGVFLEYYLANGTFKGATQYDFALIGGIVVFLAQLLAPVAMLSVKVFGFYETMCVGVCIQTLGYISASYAKTIWQLYLSQGVACGVSFAFMFVPGTVVIPNWFLKKRGVAMGICVCGSGLGGIVFLLSVDRLVKQTGNQQWALRMVGIVTAFCCVVAICITRPRNYQRPGKFTWHNFKSQLKIIFDFSVAKDIQVLLITGWFALAMLGYVLLIFTMSSYVTSIGLTSKQGSVVTAVMNTGQTVGRPLMGFAADKFGRINFTLTLTIIIFIFEFAWWINCVNYGSAIALSFFLGSCMGVGNVMNPVLTADAVEPKRFPASWSFLNIICGCTTLVAEVIALALTEKNSSTPYLHTQIFSGFMYVGGLLFLLLFREWRVRKWLNDKLSSMDKLELDETRKDDQLLIDSEEKHQLLLRPGIQTYFVRMFYPLRV